MGEPLLRLAHVSKTFPGQRALVDVDLELRSGEIHALVGENGSGKSTLIKLLSGFHRPDPGAEARVRGEPTAFADIPETVPVRTVHQDLGIIGGLSAVDNIALGVGYERDRLRRVRWREQARHTRELLARVTPEKIDIRRQLAQAPRLHLTAVAIARVLDGWEQRRGGLLIFDEPTSALPHAEIERLMTIMRDLRAAGATIMLVSHALDEVLAIADRVTVLRNGRLVATVDVAQLDEHALMELMLGSRELRALEDAQETAARPREEAASEERPVAVAVRDLHGAELRGVDVEVRRGEVLGVTGLLGSGHLELAYLLCGARRARSGEVEIGGRTLDARAMSTALAKRLGVGFVPADRVKEGLIGFLSICHNITLPRLLGFQRGPLLRPALERRDAEQWIGRMGVRPPDPAARVEVLSGGNKQKVLLAKALATATHALVVCEPTVGVDVGAKMEIYRQLRGEAASGLAVIVCSTDLTDVTAVCDRVVALRSGRVVGEYAGDDIGEHTLLAAITGIGSTAAA